LAKRGRPGLLTGPGPNEGPDGKTNDTLGDFAEDLGRLLGTAQTKATAWLEQRQNIASQLTEIRDTANKYLHQLGSEGAQLAGRFQKGRRGRPPGSGARRSVRRPPGSADAPAPGAGRTMSAAARKRISEAQKLRWAKQRKG
jgi:hypothetical protein